MSIIRIGLGENKKFAEGYDAIFGPKRVEPQDQPAAAEKTAPGTAEETAKPPAAGDSTK